MCVCVCVCMHDVFNNMFFNMCLCLVFMCVCMM